MLNSRVLQFPSYGNLSFVGWSVSFPKGVLCLAISFWRRDTICILNTKVLQMKGKERFLFDLLYRTMYQSYVISIYLYWFQVKQSWLKAWLNYKRRFMFIWTNLKLLYLIYFVLYLVIINLHWLIRSPGMRSHQENISIFKNLCRLWVLRICFSQFFQDTFYIWNAHLGTRMVEL